MTTSLVLFVVATCIGGLKFGITNMIKDKTKELEQKVREEKLQVNIDTTPLVISNVEVIDIGYSSATIKWITDEPATSQVEYGTTTLYGNFTTEDTNLVNNHIISLINLSSATKYYFRVRSRDKFGNLGISKNNIFITQSIEHFLNTEPPEVTVVNVIDVGYSSATILWYTQDQAICQIEYGTSTLYTYCTIEEANLSYWHKAVLVNLSSGTLYHFRIKSRTNLSNRGFSEDKIFFTSPKPDEISPAPVTDLRIEVGLEMAAILAWTETGDDGLVGKASYYNIRISTNPNFNWLDDWNNLDDLHSSKSGYWIGEVKRESRDVEEVAVGFPIINATHYIAVKVADEYWNWSKLSNITSYYSHGVPPPPK
jgi:hypothetical protein